MNIYDLDTFLAAADLLHFGKASRACNLSPSALTRSIQRVEEEVGQKLFTRDNRNVALTPAGERFKTYALNARDEWNALKDDLREKPSISGTLSVYASITAVYSLLPILFENYRIAHPNVHLELTTGAAEQAIDQVLAGEFDLAIAAKPDRSLPQTKFLPLTKIPLVFIAPISGELAKQISKNLDLARVPLVLPRGGLSRQRITKWMKGKGIVPDIQSEVSGNEALIAMVRLGCGIGIVPKLVLDRSPFRKEVKQINHAPKLDDYVVGLCATKRSLARPAVQAFWDEAKNTNIK